MGLNLSNTILSKYSNPKKTAYDTYCEAKSTKIKTHESMYANCASKSAQE